MALIDLLSYSYTDEFCRLIIILFHFLSFLNANKSVKSSISYIFNVKVVILKKMIK